MTRRRVPHLEQELTFREAAVALRRSNDPDGRRLKKLVIARERQTGKRIAVRLGGPKSPKLRVALGALYRAFPELRASHADNVAEAMATVVDRIDARTEKLIHKFIERRIEPRLLALEKKARSSVR